MATVVLSVLGRRALSTSGAMCGKDRMDVSARQLAKMMRRAVDVMKNNEREMVETLNHVGDTQTTPPTDDVIAALLPRQPGCSSGRQRLGPRVCPLRAGGSAKHRHRLDGLSSLYLGRMSELLASGDAVPQAVIDANVQITKVQIAGNMSRLYVYWSLGAWAPAEQTVRMQTHLAESVGSVRSALSQQQLTSHVPCVTFVHDNSLHSLSELERRLALADYGPDYRPSDPMQPIRSQLHAGRPISAEMRSEFLERSTKDATEVKQDDDNPDIGEEATEDFITTGMHDFNQNAMMSEVLSRVKQTSDAQRRHTDGGDLYNGVSLFPEAVTPDDTSRAVFRRLGQARSRDLKRRTKVFNQLSQRDVQCVDLSPMEDPEEDIPDGDLSPMVDAVEDMSDR